MPPCSGACPDRALPRAAGLRRGRGMRGRARPAGRREKAVCIAYPQEGRRGIHLPGGRYVHDGDGADAHGGVLRQDLLLL